jgi:hypothetical protein
MFLSRRVARCRGSGGVELRPRLRAAVLCILIRLRRSSLFRFRTQFSAHCDALATRSPPPLPFRAFQLQATLGTAGGRSLGHAVRRGCEKRRARILFTRINDNNNPQPLSKCRRLLCRSVLCRARCSLRRSLRFRPPVLCFTQSLGVKRGRFWGEVHRLCFRHGREVRASQKAARCLLPRSPSQQ